MPTFIAMLRGINVSGHKIIKMEQLRASFTAMCFRNTKTYIQSGNIIFEASNDSTASLSEKIGRRILGDFGFSVPVTLKTANDLSKLHVTFLDEKCRLLI
jgi:uncharacterized protein (DUF1697 family)